MASTSPKVAILGLNEASRSIIPLFQFCGFRVTCVWDRNASRAKDQCAENGIRLAEFWEQFPTKWEDVLVSPHVEVVYVATPPSQHAEIAVKALSVGRHVVCQSPLAASMAGAGKMISMTRWYPKLFGGLGSHFRFLPAVKKMKELIDEGYCGRVMLVEARINSHSLIVGEMYGWKCDNAAGGGALNILGGHLVDLVMHLTDEKVIEASGFLKTFYEETDAIKSYRKVTSDDFCSAQLSCRNGICASVTVNCTQPKGFRLFLSVTGRKGQLCVRDMDLYSQQLGEEEVLVYKELVVPPSGSDAKDGATAQSHDYLDFFKLGCKYMLPWLHSALNMSSSASDLLVEEPEPHDLPGAMSSFEEGFETQKVLSTIRQSHHARKWCAVKDAERDVLEEGDPFWQSSVKAYDSHMSLDSIVVAKPPAVQQKGKRMSRSEHRRPHP